MLDDELVFTTRLVETDARPREHEHPVLRPEAQLRISLPPHGATDLRVGILEREVPVPRGRRREIRELAFEPEHRHPGFEQHPDLAVQPRNRVDITVGRGARRGRGIEVEAHGCSVMDGDIPDFPANGARAEVRPHFLEIRNVPIVYREGAHAYNPPSFTTAEHLHANSRR